MLVQVSPERSLVVRARGHEVAWGSGTGQQ